MKTRVAFLFFCVSLTMAESLEDVEKTALEQRVGESGRINFDNKFASQRGGPEFGVINDRSEIVDGVITSETKIVMWTGELGQAQVSSPLELTPFLKGRTATLIGIRSCTGRGEGRWCEWKELTVVVQTE